MRDNVHAAYWFFFFFFQAEDGIRDDLVTGVQTCALPISLATDIDMLTGRPVIATAVARGPTRLLCVPNGQLRSLINRVPSLGDKLIQIGRASCRERG